MSKYEDEMSTQRRRGERRKDLWKKYENHNVILNTLPHKEVQKVFKGRA